MLHALRDAQLGQARIGAHHTAGTGWSTTLVKRLELSRKLEGHDGEARGRYHCDGCGSAPPGDRSQRPSAR